MDDRIYIKALKELLEAQVDLLKGWLRSTSKDYQDILMQAYSMIDVDIIELKKRYNEEVC